MTYTEQLRAWRKVKKLSQTDLGKLLGMSQQKYRYHEEKADMSHKVAREIFGKIGIPFLEEENKTTLQLLKEKLIYHKDEAKKIAQIIELYKGN